MSIVSRIGAFALAALAFCGPAASQGQQTGADAFTLAAERPADDPGALTLRWSVAPGAYLYRDSLGARLDGRELALGTPAAQTRDDPNFGPVEIYHDEVAARLSGLPASGQLVARYQGCAENGVCYAPVTRTIDLATLAVGAAKRDAPEAAPTPAPAARAEAPATNAAAGSGPRLDGGLALALLGFLGVGALLAFTPCAFPMIPILAAMLAGSGRPLSAGRGFALSSAYALAGASAYGLVGLAAGWSGANLFVALQTPLALGLSAAIFAALALSMFGLYDLAPPAWLAARFSARLAGGGRGGSLAGAAALGFGSALVVGPCATPPLAAAFLYAAETGEAGVGAAALFALGLGMGLPLVAVGTFGAGILPKSGPWLMRVRPIFGATLLAVAALLAARLMPPPAALALWGALALAAGAFLGGFDRLGPASPWDARLRKAAGAGALVYGAALIVGAAGGGADPLRPLGFLARGGAAEAAAPDEARVATRAGFEAALRAAKADGRPILVSFTASWCAVCASNEATMAAPALRRRLEATPAIAADVSAYDEEARALMARYAVAGPPTLFLLDPQGREIPGSRLVGEIRAQDFSERLTRVGL